jgi:hypothetical protein
MGQILPQMALQILVIILVVNEPLFMYDPPVTGRSSSNQARPEIKPMANDPQKSTKGRRKRVVRRSSARRPNSLSTANLLSASSGTCSDLPDAHVREETTPDLGDDLDTMEFDPTARDTLGDFGLDDDEALPEDSDFWFDPDEALEDW